MRAPILCVVGTRPEAIKLAPVILALQRHPRLLPVVVATGQHRALLARAFADFGIVPDVDLDLMQPQQSPLGVLAAALVPLSEIIGAVAPVAVVVQGDTMTTLAAAQAAQLAGVPVVHVEAGLRSGDRQAPFPEEVTRRLVAQLATLHFAPTASARAALRAEGIADSAIHITGNSGIDALRLVEARLASDPTLRAHVAAALPRLDPRRPLLLVTAHRRENHGAPLAAIAEALAALATRDGVEIVLPVHPHPAVQAGLRARLAGLPRIHLVEPLGYAAFVTLLARAAVVLTDSGGVQEEAPALGVPVLVMRDITERSEGLASGNARLVGTSAVGIVDAVRDLLGDGLARARMAEPALPYGDGAATARIVGVLDRIFGAVDARAELAHQV